MAINAVSVLDSQKRTSSVQKTCHASDRFLRFLHDLFSYVLISRQVCQITLDCCRVEDAHTAVLIGIGSFFVKLSVRQIC